MEPDSMVSVVSYNVLMPTTFDFPIQKKNRKLDQEFEYKWHMDLSANGNKEVKIEMKPDLETIPFNIAIKKLRHLEEVLEETENKSALISNINRSFSDLFVVNLEQINFDQSTITLNMNFSVENITKELESLRKAIFNGVLEVFPSMNILDIQLKYYIESLKRDFGEETKTNNGTTIWSGIALPIKKTMTPEEITKLEKYADILNEPNRYERIEKKLSNEIQKDTKSKPIMFLTEVTRKWAGKLKIFFEKKNYDAFFVPGVNPGQDYMGQVLSYPKGEYELLNHTMVFQADGVQHYPLEGFQSPPVDWIASYLHEQGQHSIGGLTVKEIKQIFDMVLNEDKKPVLFAYLRKNNLVSSAKYNGFIVGSYHMPMRVGKKIWTLDAITGDDVQKDVGQYVMGIHAYVARAKFEAFVNMMVVDAEIKKGLDGESLRDRVVFIGDMNSVPPKPGFKFCKSIPGEEEFIEHRLRYFLDGSSAAEDERLFAENELNKMMFLYNKNLKQSLDFFPAETFPPLNHVYEKIYGEFAERTTRTEEFEGALDHIFASSKAAIKHVARMPTIAELQKEGRFFPSHPMNKDSLLEDEPSDHLLQRATFDFGTVSS